MVEQVTGRMGHGGPALQGAASGALPGALIGWIFGLLNWLDPVMSGLLLALYGLVFGALVGALLGLLVHAAQRGRRAHLPPPRGGGWSSRSRAANRPGKDDRP